MRSKGKTEAAGPNAIIKFELEFLGRGPDEVRVFIVRDLDRGPSERCVDSCGTALGQDP